MCSDLSSQQESKYTILSYQSIELGKNSMHEDYLTPQN